MQINGISPLFTMGLGDACLSRVDGSLEKEVATTPEEMLTPEEDMLTPEGVFVGVGVGDREMSVDLIRCKNFVHKFGLSTGWASGVERATAYSTCIVRSAQNGNHSSAYSLYTEALDSGFWRHSESQRVLALQALETFLEGDD